ncbi:PhzF family phenazine biosynthesis protein [Microbacterium gorillae]|uniref:PhzF family phenazine biosynthesis protein n=1 Tax=Microbacterium gorillae TaxID=1231063 RepID=UPI003D95DCA7
MRQSAPRFLATTDAREDLERALGLGSGTVRRDVPTQVVSTGAEHLLVAVDSVVTVDRAVPEPTVLKRFLASVGTEGCYIYALMHDVDSDAPDAYARFFNPTVGIAEDPATGTAAGPLAALLVRGGHVGSKTNIRIEQGTAIGRRSLLDLHVAGDVVELSGSGVIAAEGTLFL